MYAKYILSDSDHNEVVHKSLTGKYIQNKLLTHFKKLFDKTFFKYNTYFLLQT